MKNIKFGFAHLTAATPAFIGRIRNSLNIALIAIAPMTSDIATEFNVREKRLQILIAIAGIAMNFLAGMFGVPMTGNSMVRASEVTEVDTQK